MKLFYASIFTFVTSMLLSSGGQAQNSILWEVSGNGLPNSSYVIGTLKFIENKEYVLPAIAKKHLLECDVFAIEDQVDHHAQHELNKAIHFQKGKSLATELSKKDYAKLQDIFKNKFKIGKGKFNRKYNRLTPLALSIAMTRLLLDDRVKFYDIELLKIATANKLRTYSLEHIEREAQALNSFPIVAQTDVLLHLMNNLEGQKKEFVMLENAYVQGDLEKVFDYSLHLFESNPNFMEQFYFKRTEEWIPKLEKMFADQKSFVAVGVLHLKGKRGLLELLRGKGYTVLPIPIN